MRSPKWRAFRRRLRWVFGLLLLLAALDYWLYPVFVRPASRVINRGENGIWLRYTWYFGEHSSADVAALAGRLSKHSIGSAFFHVRSVDAQGRLVFHCLSQAKALNGELHRLSPKLRRIAWIYAGNEHGKGHVDLRLPAVRRNMAAEAAWLVREAGFDGVQWDYEICPDGDKGLLSLLEETRAALPKGALLEAAVPGWYPWPISGLGWSASYYGEVARRTDGLAVMAYDSGMLTPRSYVWWVSEQVVRITQAAAAENPRCQVLLGVPTYKNSTLSHNASAENLRLALVGVRQGLAGDANVAAWGGVAIFADYTTSEADWREFDRLWPLNPP